MSRRQTRRNHTASHNGNGASFSSAAGFIPGCTKDRQSVTSDWVLLRDHIEGVRVREVKNVPKESGYLVEVFRKDWELDDGAVEQAFQVTLAPGSVSAWHTHRFTTDRLFVNQGVIKIVLYDARASSPTFGMVNEFRFGVIRPALVLIPPGIWHGVQNISAEPASVLNLVDKAYAYEDPDHWRLPSDTKRIPYSFARAR